VGGVTIENVNHRGSTSTVDAYVYHAMRDAMLKVLPTGAPGMTRDQMLNALVPHLPGDLFPGGAKQAHSVSARRSSIRAVLATRTLVVETRVKPTRSG